MRLLFFGSIAALACMVMFAAPQIASSSADPLVVPIAYVTQADHVLPTPYVEHRVTQAALPAFAFARMDRIRTYNDKVRFDFRNIGVNPKPGDRYLC
ncbi:hypothetical protein LJR231_001552 [Phyllobacterium sp. LjRoot231]|uniref:hypothetical protein n=1 Tax=Phyllobacterium sp. LjRoot231 TaxID=3342289 RepID=UPI003ECCBA00